MSTRHFFNFILSILISSNVFAQDTLVIYFEHDKYAVADSFKPKISYMADLLLNSSHKILYIHGFTDYTGQKGYNNWLSAKRAKEVKKELLLLGVPKNLIESVKGKGELPNEYQLTSRIPEHRKVSLVCANRKLKYKLDEVDFDSIKSGEEIIIDNLNFKPGRHYLLKESIPRLKQLLKILKDHPRLIIELQGHVCCAPIDQDGVDLDTGTQNLSVNRAKNIYEYLVRKGIDSARLSYKGYGKSKPLYPQERNESERKQNRRVEIKVLGNNYSKAH